jgi:hypothetical protein
LTMVPHRLLHPPGCLIWTVHASLAICRARPHLGINPHSGRLQVMLPVCTAYQDYLTLGALLFSPFQGCLLHWGLVPAVTASQVLSHGLSVLCLVHQAACCISARMT